MNVGLMWYDSDSSRTLEDKISRAAQRYREKFGRWPNTCFVHPQAMVEQAESDKRIACCLESGQATVHVVSAPNILVHHLWLGESNGDSPKKRMAA
jgi:hypothetical protein